MRRKRFWIYVIVFAIILCSILPVLAEGYLIRIITFVFLYAALAQSLNIVFGYAGYLSFGNLGFFGLGAYVTAVLASSGSSIFLSLLFAGMASACLALSIGSGILRLRGSYFAIASLGMALLIQQIVNNLQITGGAMGLTLPLLQTDARTTGMVFYYAFLFLTLTTTLVTYIVAGSRFGYALRAIRDNEDAAVCTGIDTRRYKTLAWTISAFLTGIIGGAYALWMTFIEPPGVFQFTTIVKTIVIVLIGGGGTVLGPIIGAVLLEVLTEVVWSQFLFWHMGVLGVVIILVVVFAPGGIPQLLQAWSHRSRSELKAERCA